MLLLKIIGVIFGSFISGVVLLLAFFISCMAIELFFSDKKLSDYIAQIKVAKGDTYRNYMKCKGQCGTCKYHEGNLNRDKVLCKLSNKQMSERDTCDYYKMHRCFKKYEGKM